MSLLQRLLVYTLSLLGDSRNPHQLVEEYGERIPSGTFNWSSIEPAKQLNWLSCYERQECARLEVPMDYSDLVLNETVAVAVIRYPANVSRSDPSYGGSILMNPGGPGGSGVNFLRWAGFESLTRISGPKHFDLVSWDPRGVENTTPQPECFANDLDRQVYWLKQQLLGRIDVSDFDLNYGLAAAEAFGQACNDTIMRYMTTYLVVQDMLAIADALQPQVNEPLINYWGISYGTYVGNIFASAFPHRIGKAIIDGVVASDDYISSAGTRNLKDADRALQYFYDTCYSVGPLKCPIYESSPSEIRAKVDNLLEQLSQVPIPVFNTKERKADVLTASQIRVQMFSAMFFPHQRFVLLAQALHDLMQTPPNITLIASITGNGIRDSHNQGDPIVIEPSKNTWDNPIPPGRLSNSEDTERIIVCSDGNPINDWNITDFRSYLRTIQSYFPLGVGLWARNTPTCARWPTSKRAPEHVRFTGPFGSNLTKYDTKRGARPLLFIGNEADPVTPLEAAFNESARHEGSVVLRTNIYGHVSVPVNPSKCVWEVMRRYWNHGELPEPGTLCEEDKWEWELEMQH